MVEASELLRLPIFADLPDDQVAWFIGQSREVSLKAGEIYSRQGDPANSMFVLLEGEFEWRGELGGETVVIAGNVGDVMGALPFSRLKEFRLTGKAVKDGRILRFPAALFPELVQKMPELAKRLVGFMADRIRQVTRLEQQRDRLAGLGKLSAGLAHELNNPASAAKRAAAQLRDTLKRSKDASHELGGRELTPAQKTEIEKLESFFMQRDEPPPDALTVSDLEDQIDSLLRSHGQSDLWQLAAELAQRAIKPGALESLFENLDAGTARAALVRIAASVEIASLLNDESHR
jgi:CRP-like cAMP-binding protein